MMNEQKYLSKYPDIADLLHNTDMTYVEIARKFGVTKQYIHWLSKRLGAFGRPTKPSAERNKLADEVLNRLATG